VTALIEISEVARTRPDAGASRAELAAWYRRKAAMLRHLGPGYRAAARRAQARAADLEADRVIA
jgi:hypothetical protein